MATVLLKVSERTFLYVGIALGLTVSLMLAPKDEFFLPNFSFYWGSQLAVLGVIFLLRPRPAIVGAMSLVVAMILLGFKTWIAIRSHSNTDGLVWLLYLVLLFGAAIGGLVATWSFRSKHNFTAFHSACITGMTAIGGSCLSITWGCYTGFSYC